MLELPVTFRFPQDAIDILLVAFLVYRILLLIKGTRAFQVLLGLILLVLAYTVSRWFELITLNWILKEFLSSFIILVVVLFQSDIRRALAQMGKQHFWPFGGEYDGKVDRVEEVVRAATRLAGTRTGAIILLERTTKLREHVEGGVQMDAVLGHEILESIFQEGSPVHDGAVLVEGGRVALAGCFLPLTVRTDLDKKLGTRHRAALGITEETDAVAVVVSEERGGVSIAVNGRITRDLDYAGLRKVIARLLDERRPRRRSKSKAKTPAQREGEP